MLTIRFNRTGKKNKTFFRLVVQEHTIAPGGNHVEILGSYDPHLKKESLKPERIKYWTKQGVKFSDTAFNFLVSRGLISGPKRAVKMPTKKPVDGAGDGATNEAKTPAVAEKPIEAKATVAVEKTETSKDEVEEEIKESEIKEENKAETIDKK
jgi:small subunit ribosomal protein S16